MATDTGQKLIDVMDASVTPDLTSAGKNVVEGFMQVKYVAHKNADANVNSTYTFTFDSNVAVRFMVDTLKLTFEQAITETNTNLATFNLVYNNGAGGSDTTIATANTAVGGGVTNTSANQPRSITLSSNTALWVVDRLSCLQLKITKAGAGGLALPPMSFEVAGHLV